MYVNNHSYFCGCIIMSSNSAIIIILNCQELCKHTVDYEKRKLSYYSYNILET